MVKNEFGAPLDRNGYAPSLLHEYQERCIVCGRTDRPLQRHEVFHGPYRQKSKKYGCWVCACNECHAKIHRNGELEQQLKKNIQSIAQEAYGWTTEQFREVFGKSYE